MAVVSEALIAGAGIAGLSADITLARKGIRAAVYDAAPRSGLEGSGLTISAIGMRAIRDLGLDRAAALILGTAPKPGPHADEKEALSKLDEPA